jgi:hypothetical protein
MWIFQPRQPLRSRADESSGSGGRQSGQEPTFRTSGRAATRFRLVHPRSGSCGPRRAPSPLTVPPYTGEVIEIHVARDQALHVFGHRYAYAASVAITEPS